VRCPEFHLDLAAGDTPLPLPDPGTLRVVIQVAGNAALAHQGHKHRSTLGDTLVLPAAACGAVWQPEGPAALLVATLPPRNS
jgi:hypothetical protein